MTDSAPKRIQRKRTKGFKLPPNCVYVGRPTLFGNPYKSPPICRDEAVRLYERLLMHKGNARFRAKVRLELKGKNLACFCPLDQPCHADVLLEIANSEAK